MNGSASAAEQVLPELSRARLFVVIMFHSDDYFALGMHFFKIPESFRGFT